MNLQLLKNIALSPKYAHRLYEHEYRELIEEIINHLSSIEDDNQRSLFISSLSDEEMIIDEDDIGSILNDYDESIIS